MTAPFVLVPATDIFEPSARELRDSEMQLLDLAQAGQRVAVIHHPGNGIVVPRSYQRRAGFTAARARMEQTGSPVSVRLSGGGVVPQMAGVVNLHLAYTVTANYPLDHVEDHYMGLCTLIARAIGAYGLLASPQAVTGSFCDGRFNLAVDGRKIAGTAQYWRRNRHAKPTTFAVLAHAVILVNADPDTLTGMANTFEAALRSPVRYHPESTTSMAAQLGRPVVDFEHTLRNGLLNPPF